MDHDDQRLTGASHLSEDTTGFGVVELRTARDLLIRPQAALDAYMRDGASAAGRYARPLRYYVAICGLMTFILLIKGGTTMVGQLPAESLQPIADQAGKTLDAFIADADNWFSLAVIPVTCLFYAMVAVPLLRWWDPEDLGWRRGFRATFVYLSAWTIPILPFTWWANEQTAAGAAVTFLMFALAVVTFLRMGRGRWFRSWPMGLLKGFALTVLLFVFSVLAFIPLMAIAFAGATHID